MALSEAPAAGMAALQSAEPDASADDYSSTLLYWSCCAARGLRCWRTFLPSCVSMDLQQTKSAWHQILMPKLHRKVRGHGCTSSAMPEGSAPCKQMLLDLNMPASSSVEQDKSAQLWSLGHEATNGSTFARSMLSGLMHDTGRW